VKTPSVESMSPLGLVEMGRLGEVPVRVVVAYLQAILGIPVELIGSMSIPAEAFLENRQQFDAGIILQHLIPLVGPQYSRVLALTTVDLCNPILTYVFGEAAMGGKAAIVSSFHLRHNEDGSNPPLELYYQRLAKVALHEVAHTLSVYHCDTPSCLMRFSAKIAHLDQLDLGFCRHCEYTLQQNLKQLLHS
jgi:archaemetzincin